MNTPVTNASAPKEVVSPAVYADAKRADYIARLVAKNGLCYTSHKGLRRAGN